MPLGATVRPKKLFYLAAEYRRAALWAICGFLVIAVTILPGGGQVAGGWPERVPRAAVCLLIAVCVSQYLWPRLRIDSDGVSRRILWWWDLWSWEAFTEGRVRAGPYLKSYEFPTRPWWRKTLSLSFLNEADAAMIDGLIRRVWRPPSPASAPDTIRVRLKWPDSRVLVIDDRGITVSKKDRESFHRWSEVKEAEIWRIEPDRYDFRKLRLTLPDQEIEFHCIPNHGQESKNWTGVECAVLAAQVATHIEPVRVFDLALHGPPRSVEEAERRISRTEDQLKDHRSALWIGRIMWCLAASCPFLLPQPKGIVMAVLTGLLAWALTWMVRDRVVEAQEQISELDQACVALTTAGVTSPRHSPIEIS